MQSITIVINNIIVEAKAVYNMTIPGELGERIDSEEKDFENEEYIMQHFNNNNNDNNNPNALYTLNDWQMQQLMKRFDCMFSFC